MPLYTVTKQGEDKPRIVSAQSSAAALKHVVTPLYAVAILSNPMEVADLVGSGIAVEKAEG